MPIVVIDQYLVVFKFPSDGSERKKANVNVGLGRGQINDGWWLACGWQFVNFPVIAAVKCIQNYLVLFLLLHLLWFVVDEHLWQFLNQFESWIAQTFILTFVICN